MLKLTKISIFFLVVNTSYDSTKTIEAFYSEAVDKLKRIVDDCLTTELTTEPDQSKDNNNKVNENNIPFIDDEEQQLQFDLTNTTTFSLNIQELSLNEDKFLSSTNNYHYNKVVFFI